MVIKIHVAPFERKGRKFLRITSPVRVINRLPEGDAWADLLALWDTGATNTCIPLDIALAIGIPLGNPETVQKMKSNEKSHYCKFYLRLPDGREILVNDAMAVPKMQAQLVIGMDVIGKGVTTIEPDGQDGVYFTFTL